MIKILFRLVGIRVIEGPEAIRVTIPKWLCKIWPNILIDSKKKLIAKGNHPRTISIVGRSIIVRPFDDAGS